MARLLILYPNTDTFGRQSIPVVLLSALLKKDNNQTELFDTTFMDINYLFGREATHEKQISKLNFYKKVEYSKYNLEKKKVDAIELFNKKVKSYRPDLIAFSFWGSHLHGEGEFHAYFHGLKIIELSDIKDIPVVVGGTVPTLYTEEALKHSKIDYVVRGEGEYVFLDMAERINSGRSFSGIKNLWIKKADGEIEKNGLRPLIDPLDQLPHADFDIYDDKSFYRPYHGKIYRCVDYELSRGCYHNCTFCLSPFQRNVYGSPKNFRREKSVVKVIDEIGYLKKRHKLEIIRYQDETFLNIKADKLKELSGAYKKHVDLPFIIEATVGSITEEKVKYLKNMGCLSVSMGLESGSRHIRDNVLKKPPFTNEEAIEKVKLIKKNGISVTLFNIIGLPEETKEMLFESIRVSHAARPTYCLASFFQPWEGTELRETAVKKGLLEDNSRGLDNSLDSLLGNSLKNLEVPKAELEDLYKKFAYYVYINQLFWPFIRYINGDGVISRFVSFLLTSYLKIRFRFIS